MDLASARIALRANMTRGRTLFLSQSFLLFNHLPQEVQDKIIRLLLPARPAAFHRVDFQLMSIYNKHVDTTTTQELRNAVKIALVFKQFHAVYKTHVLAYLPRGYIISLWSDAEYIRTTWLSGSRPILPPKPWDKVNVDVRVSRGLYDGNCVVFHMRVEHVLNCVSFIPWLVLLAFDAY